MDNSGPIFEGLERSGPSCGGTPAYLGPIFEEFGMDLEVRAAKEEGMHSEPSYKNDIVFPYKRNKMLCAHAIKITVRRHRDTAIRILGSGHCGGVGAQRIEIYMYKKERDTGFFRD